MTSENTTGFESSPLVLQQHLEEPSPLQSTSPFPPSGSIVAAAQSSRMRGACAREAQHPSLTAKVLSWSGLVHEHSITKSTIVAFRRAGIAPVDGHSTAQHLDFDRHSAVYRLPSTVNSQTHKKTCCPAAVCHACKPLYALSSFCSAVSPRTLPLAPVPALRTWLQSSHILHFHCFSRPPSLLHQRLSLPPGRVHIRFRPVACACRAPSALVLSLLPRAYCPVARVSLPRQPWSLGRRARVFRVASE